MAQRRALLLLAFGLLLSGGCYAPLHSPAIPASTLPDTFRIPAKATSLELNYASLTRPIPSEYILGSDDIVRVEISSLVTKVTRLPPVDGTARPDAGPFSYTIEAPVSPRGEILLPLIGRLRIAERTIEQAREAITEAYAGGFLDDPQVAVSLLQKSTVRVVVIGAVLRPDVYELPKYENDIAHAIARAGGLLEEEADEIQLHRRADAEVLQQEVDPHAPLCSPPSADPERPLQLVRIPLRTCIPPVITPEEVILNDGDVVVVRSHPEEVFFVVGKLSANNLVRFSLGRENRDLGSGFVLPEDRDVDVVTAVAMAGYIDPIDSPTTVTVHRTQPDGSPLLIHVDLIAARYDRRENIMVKPGDIIYLNPDGAWWFRRTFDRVLPDLIVFPYERAVLQAFGQQRQ